MKKLYFLSLYLLISSFGVQAQNYECLQNGVKHYFINRDNYLRGIKIDSVATIGDTTIYYPYRTIRSYPTYDTAGSWLGQKVIKLPNGDFLFDDILGNTALIKTQSNVGDSWLFYSDTTSETYKATLTTADTMTISGSIDSIKTITINAYHSGAVDSTSQVNNFQLIISKNNGFVKIFDLYTFPYPYSASGYPGLYSDKYLNYTASYTTYSFVESQTFIITTYHNPSSLEMYQLNVGDMFAGNYGSGGVCPNCTTIYNHYDSVIYKQTVDSFHVKYAIHHILRGTDYCYYDIGTTGGPYSNDHIDTLYTDTSLVFLKQMPEEYTVDPFVYFFYPSDTTFCYQSPAYKMLAGFVFEGCPTEAHFKKGFLPTYDTTVCQYDFLCEPDAIGYTGMTNDIMYYALKDGISCDSIILPSLTLDVKQIVQANEINIFPNPAQNELTIKASKAIQEISVTNIMGQSLFAKQYNAAMVHIDISGLPPGIYFAKINGSEVRKFVKE